LHSLCHRICLGSCGNSLHQLLASDGAMDAEFGWSVDISGDMAIVGAWQDDDNGFRSGSVYLFDVVTGNMIQQINRFR